MYIEQFLYESNINKEKIVCLDVDNICKRVICCC